MVRLVRISGQIEFILSSERACCVYQKCLCVDRWVDVFLLVRSGRSGLPLWLYCLHIVNVESITIEWKRYNYCWYMGAELIQCNFIRRYLAHE